MRTETLQILSREIHLTEKFLDAQPDEREWTLDEQGVLEELRYESLLLTRTIEDLFKSIRGQSE